MTEDEFYGKIAYDSAERIRSIRPWDGLSHFAQQAWIEIAKAVRATVYVDPVAELQKALFECLDLTHRNSSNALAQRAYDLGARAPAKESK